MANITCLTNEEICFDPASPLSNFSSEAPDNDIFIGDPPDVPDPPLCFTLPCEPWPRWEQSGCLGIPCYSTISQEDADLCAQRQAILCLNPDNSFLSDPQSASWSCGDGTTFVYTVAGGTFASLANANEANEQARAYALRQAQISRVCLSSVDACCCINLPYSQTIEVSTGSPVISWSIVSGSVPEGLTFHGGTNSLGFVRIDGIPTQNGTYDFTVRAETPTGSYSERPYTIVVLEITTTAITEFTLGEAYSFQMEAEGGSGNYLWRVAQGTLPTGLTMSSTGLISGTPTAAGSPDIQFSVIDQTCEAANRSFFVPVVESVVGSSTTYIRTRRGYAEYMAGGTGDWYKRVTYTGYAGQVQWAINGNSIVNGLPVFIPIGGSRYIYDGSSAINNQGQFISSHTKNLTVACAISPEYATERIVPSAFPEPTKLLGYCYAPDPSSCTDCTQNYNTWPTIGNYADHSSADKPLNIESWYTTTSISPTSISAVILSPNYPPDPEVEYIPDSSTAPYFLGTDSVHPSLSLPMATINGETWHYCFFAQDINWTATLSEPFTEADQIAGQLQYTSNGLTTENLPNYVQWQFDYINNQSSRYTGVNFVITCSNLLEGESYTVSYQYWRNDGVIVNNSEVFVAGSITHTILGTVPTPPSGKTITLRNVRIVYSPS